MTHVTIGVAASATVAIQALQQTAKDFKSVYPVASLQAVEKSTSERRF